MIRASFGSELDAWVRKVLDAVIRRALPFLTSLPLTPNHLSVLGTLVCLLSAVALAWGHFGWGAILLSIGGLGDMADGAVARAKGMETAFGAFLDSTLDRLVDMGLFLGLILYYAGVSQLSGMLLAGWALIAAVLTSYAKARAERFLPSFSGGAFERGERIVILILGALAQFIAPERSPMIFALGIIAIGSTWTVGQRILLAHRGLSKVDAAGRGSVEEL